MRILFCLIMFTLCFALSARANDTPTTGTVAQDIIVTTDTLQVAAVAHDAILYDNLSFWVDVLQGVKVDERVNQQEYLLFHAALDRRKESLNEYLKEEREALEEAKRWRQHFIMESAALFAVMEQGNWRSIGYDSDNSPTPQARQAFIEHTIEQVNSRLGGAGE